MLFLGKLWKMWESIEIFNLPQPREKETIWCQNQTTIQNIFSQKEHLLATGMKKTEILMNKPVYL